MNKPKDAAGTSVHTVAHTPGPWNIDSRASTRVVAGTRSVCSTGSHGTNSIDDDSWEQNHENARLIAAAPDLLAACRDMIEAMDDYECSVDDPPTPKHREMMLRAMKAVEKATHQSGERQPSHGTEKKMTIKETAASRAHVHGVVPQRFYVSTGKNRVTVDAKNAREAAEIAIDRIVNDELAAQSMGRLTMVSVHGFESEADSDVFTATESVMEAIGFSRNENGDLVRCKTCRGVGRLDCCDKIDCLNCGGLFTKDCPDC